MDLNSIVDDEFLKDLDEKSLNNLAEEIRNFILLNVSETGGHLSSNLGDVEAIIALHKVFDFKKDYVFFDVGHQAYTHKILEGKAKYFSSLRKLNGLSGFVDSNDNIHDIYEAGHSSTSISTSLGFAKIRDAEKKDFEIINFIGDASIVSGIALEAINHIANNKIIIILNDNNMAIDKPVGVISKILANLKITNDFNVLEKKLGNLDYLGVIDGHDFKALEKAFNIAKNNKNSILVHLKTIKGKGYPLAINNIDGRFHGVGAFDLNSGKAKNIVDPNLINASKAIANKLSLLMQNDKDIYVIGNGMVSSSFMGELFSTYPDRCIDNGISEDHSVSYAVGLALANKKPFVSLYSTFMQRAYDQIINDVCLRNLNVTFLIDNAGIVEASGKTHQGMFDMGLLDNLPNATIVELSKVKYINSIFQKLDLIKGPKFIRYQRDLILNEKEDEDIKFANFKYEIFDKSNKHTLICVGESIDKVKKLVLDLNMKINLIDPIFLKPLNELDILKIINTDIIVYDNSATYDGFSSILAKYLSDYNKTLTYYTLPRVPLKHGKYNDILKDLGLDEQSVILDIKDKFNL